MKEIIIATKNKGKVKDFEQLFKTKGFVVKSLLDYPEITDVEETGETFAENAKLKSQQISTLFNRIVIADDSGLSIDALNGEPGIYSARYAGEEKNDGSNIEKVLDRLEGVPQDKRTARFHCALSVTVPNQETYVVEGTCEGVITTKPEGKNGFGYDPIFYIPEQNKTMAELSSEEKNKISHRANALKKLQVTINDLFN
ncbi:XTP/dITP diphosphatase [Litchfieldia salsa]|uniref:dITP/XTP pyrophosphatase n=1 Tax=Litchfieldia salsa TaxID=930152 RepID=A0A1H0NX40_9BACI|nr:XTP/dITP diphosphatase [Litchfieldia salsa]SDO97199.1 XTP/dITP diphosphohydrolase [Litchfieldia salsa]